MRHAVIHNGEVVNMIEAEDGYVHPEGHRLIQTDEARIGDFHDGEKFVRHYTPSKDHLLGHAWRRYQDVPFFPINFTVNNQNYKVRIEKVDQEKIARFASRATTNPLTTMTLAQKNGSVVLGSQQIVALNNAITDFHLAQENTYAGLLDGIASGLVKTNIDIDDPPAPIPAWPARFDEQI